MLCLFLLTSYAFASKNGKVNDGKDLLNCEAEISIGYDKTFVRMKITGTCDEVEAYIRKRIKGGWKLFVAPPAKKYEDVVAEREAAAAAEIARLKFLGELEP